MTLLGEHQKAFYTPSAGDLKVAQHASHLIRWQTFGKNKKEDYE